MWNMMDPVPVSSDDTNSQKSSEIAEPQENLERTFYISSISEYEIRKSLNNLNKYYTTLCSEFEETLQIAVQKYLSLESELAQAKLLHQTHFSNATEDEEAPEMPSSSDYSTHNTQRDEIAIVVSVQSHLKQQENEIKKNKNVLAETQNSIKLLTGNISRAHKEINVRLLSYFKNNEKQRAIQRQKTTALEKKYLHAFREMNSLQDLADELEIEVKHKNDQLEQLRLKSQQTNSSSDQSADSTSDNVKHVYNSENDRLNAIFNLISEIDLNREVSQKLQTDGSRRRTEVEQSNGCGMNSKQKLLNTYKHLLATLKLNQKMGKQLKKSEELAKEQMRKIDNLEKSCLKDKKEITTLNDLVEGLEETLNIKDNQLKSQEERLSDIQGKLNCAEHQLNQLRGVCTVEKDSTVQVLLETKHVEHNSFSDDQTISNERNEADVDITDTSVDLQSAQDQDTHAISIFKKIEEEMQNRIINLEENSSKLQQMLVEAEEINLKLQKDLENNKQQNEDQVNLLHQLNEELKKDLQNKKEQLDMQEKDIADIQEKLKSAEQKLSQQPDKLAEEFQAILRILLQTQGSFQSSEKRIEKLEVKVEEQNAELESLKRKCKVNEANTCFIHSMVDKLIAQTGRSKNHLHDHAIINLTKELKIIRKFIETTRIDRSNTNESLQTLRLEIDELRQNMLTRKQESGNNQTSVVNQMSSEDVTNIDEFTGTSSHFLPNSHSTLENEQETHQHAPISGHLQRQFENTSRHCSPTSSTTTEASTSGCSNIEITDTNPQKKIDASDDDINLGQEAKEQIGRIESLKDDNISKVIDLKEKKDFGSPNSSMSGASTSKSYCYPQLIPTGMTSGEILIDGKTIGSTVVNRFLNLNSSVSGASTLKSYCYPYLTPTGMTSEKILIDGNTIGSTVVNRFLNFERDAHNSEEKSEDNFGDAQQTSLAPSRGPFDQAQGVVPKNKSIRASIRRIFNRRGKFQKINEVENKNKAPNIFSDLYSNQNKKNRHYKYELLSEIMRSGVPFTSWDASTLGVWLDQWVGLPDWFVATCRANVKSGDIMSRLTDSEIQNELGVKNSLHKLKLRVAIQEMVSFFTQANTTISRATLAFRELNHEWIGNYWLPSLGLTHYRNNFMQCLVDARMLDYLTEEDLQGQLNMKNLFHRASFYYGLICLKILNYDHILLEERRKACENLVSDVLVWTTDRLIKWIASIGFEKWGNNLVHSGLHGAVIALNNDFNANSMALILKIPSENVQARLKLEYHFNSLVCQATDRV